MRLASSLAIRLTGALIAVTFLATATSLLAGIYYFGVRLPMNEVRAKVGREARSFRPIYDTAGRSRR